MCGMKLKLGWNIAVLHNNYIEVLDSHQREIVLLFLSGQTVMMSFKNIFCN